MKCQVVFVRCPRFFASFFSIQKLGSRAVLMRGAHLPQLDAAILNSAS